MHRCESGQCSGLGAPGTVLRNLSPLTRCIGEPLRTSHYTFRAFSNILDISFAQYPLRNNSYPVVKLPGVVAECALPPTREPDEMVHIIIQAWTVQECEYISAAQSRKLQRSVHGPESTSASLENVHKPSGGSLVLYGLGLRPASVHTAVFSING